MRCTDGVSEEKTGEGRKGLGGVGEKSLETVPGGKKLLGGKNRKTKDRGVDPGKGTT